MHQKGVSLTRLRLIVPALVVALCLVGIQEEPAAAATSQASAVMSFARNQVGKPYKWGATGLRRYDCSGLVYRTFRETGLLHKIGGSRRTAHGYFKWFRSRGLVTSRPKQGDLVAWGRSRTTHIGIFAGYNRRGKPLAVSALRYGVSKHKVHGITVPLKAYLRVKLTR